MAAYPDEVYDPRTKENKEGVVYTPAKTTIGYAEDVTKLDNEVVAIETMLVDNVEFDNDNYNIFLGYETAVSDKGVYNLFIGYHAGQNNDHVAGETGRHNVYIGFQAGQGDTAEINNTGCFNVALGRNALMDNTSGQQNFALGYNALRYNTSAGQNVAIGFAAMERNTSKGGSVGIGRSALRYVNSRTGSNVAIGNNAGEGVLGTSDFWANTFIGADAGRKTTTGDYCVAIGTYAGDAITTGDSNTLIGYYAGSAINVGYNNTIIGKAAGMRVSSGDENIFIGFNAGSRQGTANRLLIFDYKDRGSTANEASQAIIYGVMAAAPADQDLTFNANVFLTQVKSGSDQANAGAVANEIWKTSGHATLPDNVLMIGV